MKKLLKIKLLFIVFMLATSFVFSQKFGHLNTGNILMLMPETKKADGQLKSFQDSLIALGEQKAKAFEAEYLAFTKDYRDGNLTPISAQKKQEELQKKRDEIQDFEDEVIEQVAEKRKEMLAPVLDRLQDAIDQVGKEGGYTMIFETSIFNTVLFAQESDDIEPLVKQKLGLQ